MIQRPEPRAEVVMPLDARAGGAASTSIAKGGAAALLDVSAGETAAAPDAPSGKGSLN